MKEHDRIKAQAMRTHEFVGEGLYCERWSELSSRNTSEGLLTFRAQCGYPRDLHPEEVEE